MTDPAGAPPRRVDAPTLLLTKLHAPVVPAQVVVRERLFARLREGRGRRLSLVACPAGFGKSTLLAAWREIEAAERPVAWVTLDEGDDDPVVLWSHVIEALGRVCPELAAAELLALVPAAPLHEVVLPRLVNELVEQGPLVLVLDDVHRLSGASAAAGVAWFVDRLPASLQLVLSSRVDPMLPLAALRARGHLLELRADELRFTAEEAAEFLNGRLGLHLRPDDINLLVARTEGWPAGLYLAALSLAGTSDRHELVRAFDGTSTHVVDFLAGEVLAGYAADLQAFMLRTSVLERLHPDLCDAVLERDGSDRVLRSLARTNLFLVPLDGGARRWWRFHHLFAQILRVELGRREPQLVRDLHLRAHHWHRTSGTVDEAIHHALAAHAYDDAAELIAESWVHYANAGRTTSVLEWLARFPTAIVDRDGRLLLVKAWALALLGRAADMRTVVARVRTLGDLSRGPLPDGMASIESSLSVLSATFAWGDVAAVSEHATRSAALEGPASPWYPVLTWALGWAHYCNDELDLAEARFHETVRLAPLAEQWIVAIGSIADLSLIAGMRGRRDEQQQLAEQAAELARERGLLDSIEVGEVHTALGMTLTAGGDPEAALPELERGVMLRRLWGQQLDLADGLVALGPVLAALGERARAAEVFDEAAVILAGCPDPGVLPRRLTAARRAAGLVDVRTGTDLSDREVTVLRLLGGGGSEREIGLELYLSFNTVHSHVKSIYRKLGVSTRADAVAHARRHRLL